MTRVQDDPLQAVLAQKAMWDALRTGTLRSGQFVSLSQLVDVLGFPIAAIREAVKQAGALGLLTTLPKRGIQIMEARPEVIRDCLDFRAVLDAEGARRRIAAGAFDGLDALHTRHVEMREAARTDPSNGLPPHAIEVDLSLHDFLAGGLGNALLLSGYDANRLRIAIIQNVRPFVPDRIASAMDEHLAIIDALLRRDPAAATEGIGYHCAQTMRWWGVA